VQPKDYENVLNEAYKANRDKGIVFYVVILPNKDANRYAAVKRVANTALGIATQCVVLDGMGKMPKESNKSILANIVAGINPKIGGVNHAIDMSKMQSIFGNKINLKSTIVFGLDVFHGSPQDPETRPSVVALCCSVNDQFTRYATTLKTQNARQEIVLEIDQMVEEVLAIYLNVRKAPPAHVIYYRDGVGEGDYENVQIKEVEKLKSKVVEVITQKFKAPAPKLTFIIAQKKNHLRTYATDSQKGNPYPGTLISDPNVVDFGHPNFYMYSHKALIGTARPVHYHVRIDEHGLPVQNIAEFTYLLAHLHQGCTKAVSLPAPVFYADRAAGIAGACYRDNVNNLQAALKSELFMI